jgi:hypothetical protein
MFGYPDPAAQVCNTSLTSLAQSGCCAQVRQVDPLLFLDEAAQDPIVDPELFLEDLADFAALAM